MNGPHLAVLFDRLGPYHVARVNAAISVCRTTPVELFGETRDYAWSRVSAERKTLFPSSSARDISAADCYSALDRCFGELKPDVVAIPGWSAPASLMALLWCGNHGIPRILMSESNQWDEPRNPFKEWVKGRMVACYDAALVGGQSHLEYLQQLGMQAAVISKGYDAVDNTHFYRDADAPHSVDDSYFLASARFIEKKNLGELIEAFSTYRREAASKGLPVWALTILGDGPLRGQLEKRITDLGLEDVVRLPGFIQYADLPAWYHGAGAFIHASETEQWGLVVNEAMAAGLPVLVSRKCGCAGELVSPGTNGYLMDPGQKEQMVSLMLKMSSLPETARHEMGEQSRRIVDGWGVGRFAKGMLSAVDVCTGENATGIGMTDRALIHLLAMRPRSWQQRDAAQT